MTFILEVSRPFQRRPGFHKHDGVSCRAWWLFFAVQVVTIPWPEFCTTEWEWVDR